MENEQDIIDLYYSDSLYEQIPFQNFQNYKKIFDSFDRQQTGYVYLQDLNEILRLMVINLDKNQFFELVSQIRTPELSFKHLTQIVIQQQTKGLIQCQIQCFKIFDKKINGQLSQLQIEEIFSYDQQLTDQEKQELMNELQFVDDKFYYEQFVEETFDLYKQIKESQ